MPRLTPDNLKPGMILSKPVINANGVVMLAEGTELTASLIDKIDGMDIEAVSVKGAPQSGATLEQMMDELNKRFKGVEKAPYMDIIKKAVREHIEELYG
jgi:hypothetical protein